MSMTATGLAVVVGDGIVVVVVAGGAITGPNAVVSTGLDTPPVFVAVTDTLR
jgi:hypothetical protein